MTKTIDRTVAKEISQDIADFVKTLEIKHGIELKKRTGTFDATSFNLRLQLVLTDDVRGGQATAAERAYDRNAGFDNLPPRGTKVEINGTEFIIKEWKTRGRKYKIQGENVENGRFYKFTIDQVRNATIIS